MKICKIVASVAIFFILAGVMATWISDGSVSAVKGKISQLFIEDDGNLMIRNEGIGNMDPDIEEYFVLKDWNNVIELKENISNLYIPYYIPSEFNFESFTFEKTKEGGSLREYIFKDREASLTIKQTITTTGDISTYIKNYNKKLQVNNITVYLSNNEIDKTLSASFVIDKIYLYISGPLSEGEIIKIIEHLE